MPDGFREYRKVTDFPYNTQRLTREELEAAYQNIRREYRNLSLSRSQLVRRQSEAKIKVQDLRKSLKKVVTALEKHQNEKARLQKALSHSVHLQGSLRNEREMLTSEVTDLRDQLSATTQLLEEFEQVYDEVKDVNSARAFWQLLQAARRLLTTDINSLLMKRAEVPEDEFAKEDPASINRSLRDNIG